MARNVSKIIFLALMVVGGWFGLYAYKDSTNSAQLAVKDKQIEAEKQKNDILRDVVKRIQTEKRVYLAV